MAAGCQQSRSLLRFQPAARQRRCLPVLAQAGAVLVQERPVHAPITTTITCGELGYRQDFHAHYFVSQGGSAPLGRGAYGVVYRAQHRHTSREVAVKILTKDRIDRSRKEHVAAIKQEVELWRACQDCQHVAALEEVFEDDRFVYLVQQLCRGGDLRAVLQGGCLSEQEAAQVMYAVLDVIHHCHTQKRVFGDVKPANFLLLHPHRAAGCQQFPTPKAQRINQEHLNPAAVASSTVIHEHVLANLCQAPALAGATCIPASSPSTPPSLLSAQQQQQQRTPQLLQHTSHQQQHQQQQQTTVIQISNSIVTSPPGFKFNRRPVTVVTESESCTTTLMHAIPTGRAAMENGITTSAATKSKWMSLLHNARIVDLSSHEKCVTDLGPRAPQKCSTICHDELKVLATDFGLCQKVNEYGLVSKRHTGSPMYMAPEMWQGSAGVGMAVDVWAAGVMLYQLLSGRYPFWSQSLEQLEASGLQLYQVMCGIQNNPICWEGEPWTHVSASCKDLIKKMLTRPVGERKHPSRGMRIHASEALAHPWFKEQLGYAPQPSAALSSQDQAEPPANPEV